MDGDLWDVPWGHTMQFRKNVAKKCDFIKIIFLELWQIPNNLSSSKKSGDQRSNFKNTGC
jgi:hypothetical protein